MTEDINDSLDSFHKHQDDGCELTNSPEAGSTGLGDLLWTCAYATTAAAAAAATQITVSMRLSYL